MCVLCVCCIVYIVCVVLCVLYVLCVYCMCCVLCVVCYVYVVYVLCTWCVCCVYVLCVLCYVCGCVVFDGLHLLVHYDEVAVSLMLVFSRPMLLEVCVDVLYVWLLFNLSVFHTCTQIQFWSHQKKCYKKNKKRQEWRIEPKLHFDDILSLFVSCAEREEREIEWERERERKWKWEWE
jgi:hypothetical protein